MKTLNFKKILVGIWLAIALALSSLAAAFIGRGVTNAYAEGSKIDLVVEVSDFLEGQENPEFTVTLKVKNNTGTLGCVEIVITPLDENVVVGSADECYVKGDTWSTANGFARVDDGVNIHLIGTDDTGITKPSFTHGGFKFKYNGTPTGDIQFNVALEAVSDDIGDEVDTYYNGEKLVADYDYTKPNLPAAPKEVTPVAKPVAGTTENGYTGSAQDFTPDGLAALISAGSVKLYATENGVEKEVGIAAFKPVNAGEYKVVARPVSGYCWVGGTNDDAEYNFKVNKAKITAVPPTEDGKLPEFKGGSYTGSLAGIVGYKYYSDEACTTEVAQNALKAGITYYAKASLKDGAEENFEFDSDTVTQTLVNTGVECMPVPPAQITKPVAGTTENGYTGSAQDFTPSGLAALVSVGSVKLYAMENGVEKEVGVDAFKPVNAGEYKVVARPAAGYTWSDGTSADAEYNFKVNKAKITAVPATEEGKLATFKAEGFSGSLADVVGYKYYSDAECTQEIAESDLAEGTAYYAKASLKDEAEKNFEFDSDDAATLGVIGATLPYTKPTTGGNTGNNPNNPNNPDNNSGGAAKASIPYWVWIIVGVAAFLLLLLLLLLLLKGRNKDKERISPAGSAALPPQPVQPVVMAGSMNETNQRADKMEERMREMENQAHEREIARYKEEAERAARKAENSEANATNDISSQNLFREFDARLREMEHEAQLREVARYKEEVERGRSGDLIDLLKLGIVREMFGGKNYGGNDAEINSLKTEISAMRAEASAKEMEAYKAESRMAQAKLEMQLANMANSASAMPAGLSARQLSDMIAVAVQNAVEAVVPPRETRLSRAQEVNKAKVVRSETAQPVSAAYPPDAVTTTVTTTRVDTTKKSEQPTRAANTDGMMFDVGGFYDPASERDMKMLDRDADTREGNKRNGK